jgi:hypothetical protein
MLAGIGQRMLARTFASNLTATMAGQKKLTLYIDTVSPFAYEAYWILRVSYSLKILIVKYEWHTPRRKWEELECWECLVVRMHETDASVCQWRVGNDANLTARGTEQSCIFKMRNHICSDILRRCYEGLW